MDAERLVKISRNNIGYLPEEDLQNVRKEEEEVISEHLVRCNGISIRKDLVVMIECLHGNSNYSYKC